MRSFATVLLFSCFVACGPAAPSAFPEPLDPQRDAGGVEPLDAGETRSDAGPLVTDAGPLVTDAGAAVVDAGGVVVDAGGVVVDAGVVVPDAGCVCALPNYCNALDRCVSDAVPPRVTVQVAPNAANTQLHVTGTAADEESGLALVTLALGNGPAVAVLVQAGAYQVVLPITLMGAVNVFTVTATAADRSGNQAQATASRTIDVVPPTITLSPSQDAACTSTGCTGAVIAANANSFQLSADVTDGLALAGTNPVKVRVLDGASVVVPSTNMTLASGSTWSFTWSTVPLVDGRFYSLEVTATDSSGNVATRALVVLVDRVNPSLLVNSPRQGTLVGTSQVTVNASATDGHGLKAVELARDPAGPWAAATLDANGDWVGVLAVPAVDAVEQVLSVRAVDLVGNTRSATTRYTADRVAPRVAIVGSTDAVCLNYDTCVGTVLNAASTTAPFQGTVVDGEPMASLSIRRTIVESLSGATVTTATDPAVAGANNWNFTWAALPAGVNGAFYQLRVSATDAAGNASAEAVRNVWVDTVAPTVSIPVDGQRLVSRTAALAVFSEPMGIVSVRTATTFTPAVTVAELSTPDRRSFSFTTGLAGYTPYAMTISGATDQAGNPLAATASASFLTELAPLAFPAVVASVSPNYVNRLPRVAVDGDGRPTVGLTQAGPDVNSAVVAYDGASAFTALGFSVRAWSSTLVDLRLSSSSQLPSRRLQNTFTGLFVSAAGPLDLEIADVTEGISYIGPWVSVTAVPAVARGALRPMLERVPYTNLLSGPGVTRTVVTPSAGASAMYSTAERSGSWVGSVMGTLTSFRSLEGRASVEGTAAGLKTVRFWDGASSSVVGASTTLGAATAQAPLKTTDRFGLAVATTAAYVAYVEDSLGNGKLSIACSATPFATTPNWLSTTVTLPSRVATANPLASAFNANLFVVAGEFGGSVNVYKTPQNSACNAVPVLTLVGTIAAASEPGLALDAAGNIWVVYVSTATGAVMLTRY